MIFITTAVGSSMWVFRVCLPGGNNSLPEAHHPGEAPEEADCEPIGKSFHFQL
jgi:hypothetical protein